MSTSDPGPSTPAGDDPYRRADQQGATPPEPYGQAPYGPPPGYDPYAPAAPAPRNGLGIAALVVGIVALALAWIPLVGFVGLVAVVLGIIALSRVRRGLATNRGVSITGVVLGAVAVVAAIGWVVLLVVAVNNDTVRGVADCASLPTAQQQACVEDALGAQP